MRMAFNNQITPKRWNLFARELEDILQDNGFRLGHLDDRAGIHRVKVLRLQHSLVECKNFPVLNPEELEQVEKVFNMTRQEHLRLLAALLSTGVERMLMDRLPCDRALLAAEQIQSIILESFDN